MTADSGSNPRGILSAVKRALPYLALLATLLPVALYAWLGQYTRPLIDDYYTLRIGRELGPWDGMHFHFNSWSGGFVNFYIKSAMAPLDILAPPVTTWLLIAIWLIAALWLARGLLPRLGIERPRWKLELAIAASIVTASIYAQYSLQTYYWHAASIAYSMPIAVLTMFLALVAGSPLRSASLTQILWRALAGALLCFLSAGFHEIVVVGQTALLTAALFIALAFCRGECRRNILLLLGTAWLATLASLWIQFNSPGVALRMDGESVTIGMTFGEYLDWAARAAETAISIVGRPQTFAGFALLFCVSFAACLYYFRPRANASSGNAYRLSRPLLWLALLAQLLLLVLLWAHQSDDPQIFGRFSLSYMAVIGASALLVLCCVIGLWQRRRVNMAITHSARSSWIALCLTMAAALILFWLTQPRSIHWRASSYLYLSTLLLLALLAAQLAGWLRDKRWRSFFFIALLSTLVAWALLGGTVFIALIANGYFKDRILAQAAYFMVFSGLVWGPCLGCLIKQWLHERGAGERGIQRLGLGSALVALALLASIVTGPLRLIPDLAGYARAWDERHQTIIDQRDQGVRDVKAPPLSFNMYRFLELPEDPEVRFRYALAYYGVDSITEVET